MGAEARDEIIDRLARLFREHPAWVEAAGYLSSSGTSAVYFTHRPDDAFHLEQRAGRVLLLPGAAVDPDLVFRFAPASIDRLETVEGGVGEFAVALLELTAEEDPELHVDIRIAKGFTRLALLGYVRLLVAAGPKLVAFGARYGIRNLGSLRRFISEARGQGPDSWEVKDGASRRPARPGARP